MTSIHPYLFFSGNCREAFTRYSEIFSGELTLITGADMPAEDQAPPEMADLIMHAALNFGDDLLMGSDDPTGDGGPVKGMSVSFSAISTAEAERVFNALSDGGQVTMPLEKTSWSPMFGACIDRFGMSWMIDTQPDQG